MYKKPKLERFGTFRELTRSGTAGGFDLVGIIGDNTNTCTAGTNDCYIRVSHS